MSDVKKVFVTESLSGVFGLAHRKGMVHSFPAKRAQEIVDSGRGEWVSDKKAQKKETAAQNAKATPAAETATDKAAANAEKS